MSPQGWAVSYLMSRRLPSEVALSRPCSGSALGGTWKLLTCLRSQSPGTRRSKGDVVPALVLLQGQGLFQTIGMGWGNRGSSLLKWGEDGVDECEQTD